MSISALNSFVVVCMHFQQYAEAVRKVVQTRAYGQIIEGICPGRPASQFWNRRVCRDEEGSQNAISLSPTCFIDERHLSLFFE